MANILVKFPTRGRPDAFFRTLDSFIAKQSGKHDIHYLVSLDDDDDTVDASFIDGLKAHGIGNHSQKLGYCVNWIIGIRAGKIGSCNRDMQFAPPDWDIVMQIADDFICHGEDWDDVIVEELEAFEDKDGALWVFDGYQQEMCTLSIMTRKYYERFEYIYYPEYITFYPDREWTEVADLLGKLVFIKDVLFEHRHPDWMGFGHGYSGANELYDDLYKENDKQEDRDHDEALFNTRKLRNFDLDI